MPWLVFFLLFSLPQAYFLLVSRRPVCPGLFFSCFFLSRRHTFYWFPAVRYAPACFFLSYFSSAGILFIGFPPSGMPRLAFFSLISLLRAYFLLVSRRPVCPGLLFSHFFLFRGHTFYWFPVIRYAPACFFLAYFSSAGILFIGFPSSGMPKLAFFLLFSLLRAYFSLVSRRLVCPSLLFSCFFLFCGHTFH